MLQHLLGQLQHGKFARVAQVHRAQKVGARIVHHAHDALDQIVHILKTAGLGAVSVNGQVLPAQRLHDKVAHHAPILGVHIRAVCIKNTDHLDLYAEFTVVIKAQCLGAALAFVITAADADGVHAAAVGFHLRMHLGVAIYLAGRKLQQCGIVFFCQLQHIQHAENAGFGGIGGAFLISRGAGRAGRIINLVAGNILPLLYIPLDKTKPGVLQKGFYVAFAAGKQIVQHGHLIFGVLQQSGTQIAAQKACAAGYQNSIHCYAPLCQALSLPLRPPAAAAGVSKALFSMLLRHG